MTYHELERCTDCDKTLPDWWDLDWAGNLICVGCHDDKTERGLHEHQNLRAVLPEF